MIQNNLTKGEGLMNELIKTLMMVIFNYEKQEFDLSWEDNPEFDNSWEDSESSKNVA